jgi:hydroxyacylglutathione hydrolase
MLFERIESKGLAHYSYLVADGTHAVVIDPRRDCEVYVERAAQEGFRIATILETHRNEDYVIGSVELAAKTGAEIWHADWELPYEYGNPVEDGQTWHIGRLRLKAIHTPGHTPGSMSYLLHDPDGFPWVVFTGDALFAGDVGRTDLVDVNRREEMAELLYDSLFNKLLPLGDSVIVCPGHGSGSVCGAAIAERVWTTIGLEKQYNTKLQYTGRKEFVTHVAQVLERPPYFRRMEEWNLTGAPPLSGVPVVPPLGPGEFDRMAGGSQVLDTRMELGFAAAHVPGAVSIWLDGVPSFAGWFLTYEQPLLMVNESPDSDEAMLRLLRIGFDNVSGSLAGGMLSWHRAGRQSSATKTVFVQELCTLLDEHEKVWILDVRSSEEIEHNGEIGGAQHIHLTRLPERMNEVPKDRSVYVFCGSGLRSMIAASLLQRSGWEDVAVVLGGLAGWSSVTCPIR